MLWHRVYKIVRHEAMNRMLKSVLLLEKRDTSIAEVRYSDDEYRVKLMVYRYNEVFL